MYLPRSSKTAFCDQPLRKGKPIPNSKPGPKYSSNRRNIALVQFIQVFCRGIKIEIKRLGGIEHRRIKLQVSYGKH